MSEKQALREILDKIEVQLHGLEPGASEDTRNRLLTAKEEIERRINDLDD